ncbi:hypothetical protein [Agriterribacter sp.]|uniref:hypothetical protein n=1 Tax=Agriterribacter sp. TaxID=2821509 RepID=UPI002CF298DD|nr:hypothetical protein [Agriterribacter sp.]HTN05495.1 hypothetical protein [Agriterribacter sp.]
MKKEEIDGCIEDKFKKIARYFHKAVDNFETEDINDFRIEIKKLKVFLHLINMESGDELLYRITKRMKTIYGYLGVIRNLQLQLKKMNEYVKKTSGNIPVRYVHMLEKELEFWKKISKDFIVADYDFFNDKKEIINTLPDKLTKRSIRKFIHYTLYELQTISGHPDDYSLDNTRKFIEDIYYNYAFIKPFVTERQTNLFDEEKVGACLELFNNFRDTCMVIVLLQTYGANEFNESEKKLLKEMENDWMHEKKELKDQLFAKLDSLHITANNINEFAFEDALSE